jgi:hypothetical protein
MSINAPVNQAHPSPLSSLPFQDKIIQGILIFFDKGKLPITYKIPQSLNDLERFCTYEFSKLSLTLSLFPLIGVRLQLDDPLGKFVPFFSCRAKENIRVKDLFSDKGLGPFENFTEILKEKRYRNRPNVMFNNVAKRIIFNKILRSHLELSDQYSVDLNYFILEHLIELLFAVDFKTFIKSSLKLSSLDYYSVDNSACNDSVIPDPLVKELRQKLHFDPFVIGGSTGYFGALFDFVSFYELCQTLSKLLNSSSNTFSEFNPSGFELNEVIRFLNLTKLISNSYGFKSFLGEFLIVEPETQRISAALFKLTNGLNELEMTEGIRSIESLAKQH